MTALVKIQTLLTKLGNVTDMTGKTVADALRARKKADIKVIGTGNFSVVVATDEGDTLRIVPKSDVGFAQFVTFLKRKSSVLLPKMELVLDTEYFQVFKTERLTPLNDAISSELANKFGDWISNYAEQRKSGRAVRGAVEATAPAELTSMVHVGNLRGMINKIVQFRTVGQMDLCPENFMIRQAADGAVQLVVNDPYHPQAA